MAIRLGFLIENFLYNYIFKPFVEIAIQILIFLSAMLTLSLGCLWINHYPVDNSIGFASVYPLEYPSFEQLGPGQLHQQQKCVELTLDIAEVLGSTLIEAA